MDDWSRKGATLSDTSAMREFGLTREEIYAAVRSGRLRYREGCMHGNPWLRLLRSEVEAVVRSRHGAAGLRDRQRRAQLAKVERELRALRRQVAALEAQRSELLHAIRK